MGLCDISWVILLCISGVDGVLYCSFVAEFARENPRVSFSIRGLMDVLVILKLEVLSGCFEVGLCLFFC